MYNALLNRVVEVIKTTVAPNPRDSFDEVYYSSLFSPDKAQALLEEKRKKQDMANKLVVGATALAVVGELFHIAKRSGVIDKVLKR